MNNEHITDDQRKAFIDLLKDAERGFEKDFDGYFDSIKRDFTPKVEARSRVRNLFEKVRSLRSNLTETLRQLQAQGYRVEDGMIAIDYEPQNDWKDELEQVKSEALTQRNAKRLKFRKALFDVLSAQTVEEARRIVEEIAR